MPSRVLVLPPSRSSIMAKVKSLELQQESHALTRPEPAVKPFKEPLIPDTHNSTFMATEDEYVNTPSSKQRSFKVFFTLKMMFTIIILTYIFDERYYLYKHLQISLEISKKRCPAGCLSFPQAAPPSWPR